MCNAKPGNRCSGHAEDESENAKNAYNEAHPSGPAVNPCVAAETEAQAAPARRMPVGRWTANTVEEAFASAKAAGGPVIQTETKPQVDAKGSVAAMRHDLRAIYNHKFSVRMSTGTGYGWASVTWEDGPRDGDVRRVADTFCAQKFNGMTDSYDSVNQDAPVRYSLRGVNTSRKIGPAGQKHIDAVFARAGLTGFEAMDRSDPTKRDSYNPYDGNWPLSNEQLDAIERAVDHPVTPRYNMSFVSAATVADWLQRFTDYSSGKPVTDFESRD